MTLDIALLAVALAGSGAIPKQAEVMPGQSAAWASTSDFDTALSGLYAGHGEGQGSLPFTKVPSMIPVSQHDDDLGRTRGRVRQLQVERHPLGWSHDGGVRGIEAGGAILARGVNDDVLSEGGAKVLHLEANPSIMSARDQGDPSHVNGGGLLVGLEGGGQLGVSMTDEVAQPDHERRQKGRDDAGRYRRVDAEGSSNVADKGGESLHLLLSLLFGTLIGGGLMVAVLSRSRSLRVKALSSAAVGAILLYALVNGIG